MGLAAATGLGALGLIVLSFRIEAVRNWRIRRYVRRSHQPEEVVRTWFKGSYNLLSDSLYRFMCLCAATVLALVCIRVVMPSVFLVTLPNYPKVVIFPYGLGIAFDLTIFTLALTHVLVAEALTKGRLVASLPYYDYNYVKAEEGGRFWLRYGLLANLGYRFFGLVMFGIAWFFASVLYDSLRAALLLTVGRS